MQTHQLEHLTDFIWQDYRPNLAATLGRFTERTREATDAMMRRYIANSFPFVYSFNDMCRMLVLRHDACEGLVHAEVFAHARSDLDHYELYIRDYAEHRAWEKALDIEPFISLHNALWRGYAATPPEYHYHLLLVYEVMSTAWLACWHTVSSHHRLDYHFLGDVHLSEDDYKQHLLSHREVFADALPQQTFWALRRSYDEISSGFVTWFSRALTQAEREDASSTHLRSSGSGIGTQARPERDSRP
ncbi:MAG: hypothetical protein AAFV53_00880 [Myxococcota bacterium]